MADKRKSAAGLEVDVKEDEDGQKLIILTIWKKLPDDPDFSVSATLTPEELAGICQYLESRL
jgi:hypothetical protein